MLRKYMSDRGKIRSRRVTGNCAQHQRGIAMAIKTARELMLLPYTQRTVTERPSGRRGPGREGRGPGERRGPRPSDTDETAAVPSEAVESETALDFLGEGPEDVAASADAEEEA